LASRIRRAALARRFVFAGRYPSGIARRACSGYGQGVPMLRKLLPALLIVAALAALAWLLLAHEPPPAQSFKVRGVTVSLLPVTYGPTNTFVIGTPFRRMLYRNLPGPLKHFAGCTVATTLSWFTNSPVFWVQLKKPAFWDENSPYLGLRSRLVDEYGTEYEDYATFGEGGFSVSRDIDVRYFDAALDSPHGRPIGMAFYDPTNSQQELGRLFIPGAKPLLLPESKPAAPQAQQTNGLSFQLTSVTTGLHAMPDQMVSNTNNPFFTQAVFHISRNGAPAPEWFPEVIRVTNPQEARRPQWNHAGGRRGGDCVYNFEGLLDPGAGPWSFEVDFTHQSDFAPDELITIPHVPFPAAGGTTEPNLSAQVQGVTVSVVRLYGVGAQGPRTGFAPNQPFVEATVSPTGRGIHLQLVGAVDEQGRNVNYGSYSPQGHGHCCFSFQGNTKARSVDLTFAVHHSIFVTFAVNPSVFDTNAVGSGVAPH
jgi:hypothetical protein